MTCRLFGTKPSSAPFTFNRNLCIDICHESTFYNEAWEMSGILFNSQYINLLRLSDTFMRQLNIQ